ncbi:MAG: PfaD family polyunsaturated fatty acid/polyketide biosynthesis protein [Myxococcota bacterium]
MHELSPIGRWNGAEAPRFVGSDVLDAARRCREPAFIVRGEDGAIGVALGGGLGDVGYPVLAVLSPLYPEWLGGRSFVEAHGLRFAYVVGEMANGIATAEMVIAAAEHGMLGFFGAAGLSLERVAAGLDRMEAALGPRGKSYGSNLIHSPHEPELEAAVADLYLSRGVTRVSASAYMELTLPLVRYAATGLRRGLDGRLIRRNHVFAKISRPEVAARFLAPPPAAMLEALVAAGQLEAQEAALAAEASVATEVTVEADSGGHTDNQALTVVFPTVLAQCAAATRRFSRAAPIRVGAAGGIGAPGAVAAAFAMGADYVLTGSINQAAVESGLSPGGRALLAEVRLGDVTMAPAADMFEMGVKVQVLRRGTLFAARAQRLYEAYRGHASWAEIPAEERQRIEREILKAPYQDVERATRDYFAARAPAENERAAQDPRHAMALVFRAYLGQASKWAIAGDAARALDYQIWCGPAMGAFNAWAAGSFLQPLEARTVGQIGLNLMEGAAVSVRAHQLRAQGISVPDAAFQLAPRPLELEEM